MRRKLLLALVPFRTADGKARPLGICLLGIGLCGIVFVLAGYFRKDKAPEIGVDLGVITSKAPPGGATEITDLWRSSIKAQLAHIANAISNPDGDEMSMALADRINIADPQQFREQELYAGQSVRIVALKLPEELGTAALIEVDKSDFINRIRPLLSLGSEAPEDAVHLKLFGIGRDGEILTSKQRLTAKGTRGGNELRLSAVVEATWITPTTDGPPQLTGFTLTNLVQSELTSAPASIFEDIASDVLGRNPAWEQLRLGMNTWGRRIENSLNPDFLGYHGLAIGDVDGDGLEDLYLCQPGGLPNLLFRQTPDGKMTDISAVAGVDFLDNSTGALLVDVDNDGDADLAVATKAAFLVMENDGTGKFTLRGRYPEIGLGYSPTAADYDLDGDLDFLVLRYGGTGSDIGDFPTPHPFRDARNGGANVLLENQGGFQFLDATESCGLGVGNHRFSFAASWEDFDNDGLLDVYIANDFGPNQLFRNDGKRFKDVSVQSGSQDWGFGMSATWADYDRDGYMDLYVSNMFSSAGNQIVPQANFDPTLTEEIRKKYLKMVRGNSLLRNSGSGSFSDVTAPMNEGFGGWAWGSQFADLNNDGWEDLYVANGYITQEDKDDL
jgi:hypothetical protein